MQSLITLLWGLGGGGGGGGGGGVVVSYAYYSTLHITYSNPLTVKFTLNVEIVIPPVHD